MKELIEIPDSNVIANTEGCFGINFDGMDYQKIIMGGTPIPDNVTNGDIIKAMFPKIEIYTDVINEIVDVEICEDSSELRCSIDWWNAPYMNESEEQI